VAISLTALSASGCEAAASCQVPIVGVQYDYGDAPIVYDMNINYEPPAAASTLFAGMLLGSAGPTTETLAHNSFMADGDGGEEDALTSNPYTAAWPGIGGAFDLQVNATNNTAGKGYLHAFVDWNADGDFLDSLESSLNTVTTAPLAGLGTYVLNFTVPPFANASGLFYIRLRLSVDSMAVTFPYLAAPRGETEDYVWESIGILPVELLSFTALDAPSEVHLQWTTVSEHNTSHFEVERSVDALRYDMVGSTSAAGESYALIDYSLIDARPLHGLSYYRLKQVDRDGSTAYFGPVAVQHSAAQAPWVHVEQDGSAHFYANGSGRVQVLDHLGRLVGSGTLVDGHWQSVQRTSGAYVALVQTEKGTEHVRFVVP
jgi:hypothetical protein